MKLHARNVSPRITVDLGARRPVLLRIAGLFLAMSPEEALTLADQLHDAAMEPETMPQEGTPWNPTTATSSQTCSETTIPATSCPDPA
ncbi:hypothetical protein [Rhodococcus sp. AH-ZY2]|uniref:hypothetical protein n=1 Tax=Rhodococcus sp. AH-ZY2 TaxID=3047468 RepID=UPI0027E02594|nr:hypothetical protein [Rhodococcus sp. AH-ZY2]WML63203.1 hypothetical protein QNA09_25910 [Rhodococcus sp. AH-ZY2]WML64269.1 hypothetical protein QNA09_05555 [Rhodococcus sp. AH-ZY2]